MTLCTIPDLSGQDRVRMWSLIIFFSGKAEATFLVANPARCRLDSTRGLITAALGRSELGRSEVRLHQNAADVALPMRSEAIYYDVQEWRAGLPICPPHFPQSHLRVARILVRARRCRQVLAPTTELFRGHVLVLLLLLVSCKLEQGLPQGMFGRCLTSALVCRTMELADRANAGYLSFKMASKTRLQGHLAGQRVASSSDKPKKVSISTRLRRQCSECLHDIVTRCCRSTFSLGSGSARAQSETHVPWSRATCFSRGPHGEWGSNSSAFDLGHHPSFQAYHSHRENRGPHGILRFSAPAWCHIRQIAVLAVKTMPRRHAIRTCPTKLNPSCHSTIRY